MLISLAEAGLWAMKNWHEFSLSILVFAAASCRKISSFCACFSGKTLIQPVLRFILPKAGG